MPSNDILRRIYSHLWEGSLKRKKKKCLVGKEFPITLFEIYKCII